MIHFTSPYRTDKNLGQGYNEFMRLIGENDWACFMDCDVMLLTPDAGKIIHNYAYKNPKAGLLTCYTNRVGNKSQLIGGQISEDPDIRNHIKTAEDRRKYLYKVTEMKQAISGMLMLVSKRTWNEIKFIENGGCLGVDTTFSRELLSNGKKILRMEGLFCFHIYRLTTGIKDKSHLL